MNFDLSEDQKMLADTAASFVKKSSPVERFRKLRFAEPGWDPAVWKQMGELGWLGVIYPEELGGFGGRFVDLALILVELGKSLVPEPILPSVVLAGRAILLGGTEAQQKRWLEPMIAGDTVLALAYAERDARFDPGRVATTAARSDTGYVLTGDKVWVLAGHAADHIVVSARTGDGVTLFVVDRGAPGLSLESVKTMDGHRAGMLRLEGVEVGADAVLGPVGGGLPILEDVLDGAAAAACAEGLGTLVRSLDMTLEYLKTREQFGVKIGVFQALQHKAVDMFVEVETCRSLTYEAALRMDEGDAGERRAAIAAAKAYLATGGRQVTGQAIQLHGGIGVTEEHDIGLFFKRHRILSTLFGDADHHVRRFASLPSFEP